MYGTKLTSQFGNKNDEAILKYAAGALAHIQFNKLHREKEEGNETYYLIFHSKQPFISVPRTGIFSLRSLPPLLNY